MNKSLTFLRGIRPRRKDLDNTHSSPPQAAWYYEKVRDKFALMAEERIASIRDVQKNPSSALRGITRVTRGSKTIGFFLSNDDFAELVENQEALLSKAFVRQVAQARRQAQSKKLTTLSELAADYEV